MTRQIKIQPASANQVQDIPDNQSTDFKTPENQDYFERKQWAKLSARKMYAE
jgi:hypothetical protein